MKVLFFLDLWASDKGTYICEAENQFGKIQSQTTLTVTGLGKINLVLRHHTLQNRQTSLTLSSLACAIKKKNKIKQVNI